LNAVFAQLSRNSFDGANKDRTQNVYTEIVKESKRPLQNFVVLG